MSLTDYRSWFRDESVEIEAQSIESARSYVEWSSCEYHKKFLEWLDSEAGQVIDVGDDRKVVNLVIRANTFREIRARLDRDLASAQDVLRQIRQE